MSKNELETIINQAWDKKEAINKNSDKKIIDAIVTKIGPPKVRDTTSAKGKCLRPKKIHTKAIEPQIALKACKPGLVVL